MRQKLTAATLLLMALVVGCTTIPQTPDQTVYATYGLYVAVASSTADALDQGMITVDQARQIQATLAEVRPRIDTAMQLVRSGIELPSTSLEALRAVQKILLQAQSQLEASQ